jgi:hypothetical protein
MTLQVTSVRLANPTRQQFLHTALKGVHTPPGEQWLARLSEHTSTGAWELVVAGPGGAGECEGWEASRSMHERRGFRAVLTSRADQSAAGVRRHLRRLAWNGVRFSVNSMARSEPELARSFEDAVWDVVQAENQSALEVRLNFWRPVDGELHCYCEVEAAPLPGELHPWHFWCPLVRTPRELALVLAAALRERRGEPEHALEALLQPTAAETLPRPWPSDGAHPLEKLVHAEEDYTQGATHWT